MYCEDWNTIEKNRPTLSLALSMLGLLFCQSRTPPPPKKTALRLLFPDNEVFFLGWGLIILAPIAKWVILIYQYAVAFWIEITLAKS